jgi:hypothetical protein
LVWIDASNSEVRVRAPGTLRWPESRYSQTPSRSGEHTAEEQRFPARSAWEDGPLTPRELAKVKGLVRRERELAGADRLQGPVEN